jgi:pilus assembly protein Flp/PilA
MLRFKWTRPLGRRPRIGGFAKDEAGATAIEYALIAFFISIAIVVAAPAVGTAVSDLFDLVAALF